MLRCATVRPVCPCGTLAVGFAAPRPCVGRSGGIGFTGDLANDVKREYCEQVAKQQRMLSRAYRAIFSHWEPNTIPYTGAGDAAVEPLVKSIANDATSD